jgi:hypothetical protein
MDLTEATIQTLSVTSSTTCATLERPTAKEESSTVMPFAEGLRIKQFIPPPTRKTVTQTAETQQKTFPEGCLFPSLVQEAATSALEANNPSMDSVANGSSTESEPETRLFRKSSDEDNAIPAMYFARNNS